LAVRWAGVVSRAARSRRGARPRVLALRALPGREGGRHRRRRVPRPGPARGGHLASDLGRYALAVRLRVGGLAHGGVPVPALGAAHTAGGALRLLGERGARAADRVRAPGEHPSAAGWDGESVPDAEGDGRVKTNAERGTRNAGL